MAGNLSSTKITKPLLVCGILLLSAICASWKISEESLANHECLVSITAREMLQSGDWIVPTCNGQSRLEKTPLSYWLVAASSKITGEVDELATRLPNAVLAVLSVAAILYFVNQWLGFRAAAICACVWATSLAYIRYSRNARPEMPLTFFIVLCFLSFYSAITTNSRTRQVTYMLIFWISFALANLAKGPAPLPLVLIPLFFYIVVFRQWKVVPKLLPVIGPILFLAIVLPWPLAIAHKFNWDLALWKLEFVDRFFGEYAPGDKPLWYYFPRMFSFIAPWLAFLPIALAAPFYKPWTRQRHPIQFLWLWLVADLVFLTICGGKRQHYILPIMPAAAILIGILIESMAFDRRVFARKFAANLLRIHIIVLLIGVVGGLVYIAKAEPQLLDITTTFAIATLVVITAVGILFMLRRPALGLAAAFTGIVVLVMIAVGNVSRFDDGKYSRDFARSTSRIVPQSEEIVAYEYISMRSVHYLGRTIAVIKDMSVLYDRYSEGAWIIATAGHLEKLLQDGRFRQVYSKQDAEFRNGEVARGALFHKSAPVIKDDHSRDL